MMRAVLVILALLAHVAHADDRTAQIKAMVEVQRKALLAGDDKAFQATFTSDGVLAMQARPSTSIETWAGGFKVTEVKILDSKIGWSGAWGWVAIEARISSVLLAAAIEAGSKPRPVVYHWIALVVPAGDGVKTKAMAISRTQPDKDLDAYNEVQEFVPRSNPPAVVDALAHPAQLGKLLAPDAATSVFGTSDRDRGLGAPAAKKLVGGWGKVVLEVIEPAKGQKYADPKDYEPFELDLGDVKFSWARLRMKFPGQPKWIRVNACAIARKTASGFEIVAADLASDRVND